MFLTTIHLKGGYLQFFVEDARSDQLGL